MHARNERWLGSAIMLVAMLTLAALPAPFRNELLLLRGGAGLQGLQGGFQGIANSGEVAQLLGGVTTGSGGGCRGAAYRALLLGCMTYMMRQQGAFLPSWNYTDETTLSAGVCLPHTAHRNS
jgi:hypothetical protein